MRQRLPMSPLRSPLRFRKKDMSAWTLKRSVSLPVELFGDDEDSSKHSRRKAHSTRGASIRSDDVSDTTSDCSFVRDRWPSLFGSRTSQDQISSSVTNGDNVSLSIRSETISEL